MDHEQLNKILPYLGQVKEKGNEIHALYCPFCSGGRHKDTYTFAINKSTGAYNCLRGSCGEAGNLFTLGKFLGVEILQEKQSYFREYRKPKKIYKIPKTKTADLTKPIIDYFKLRGVSEEILIKNRVTSHKGNIAFNFYLDGELVFIKYKLPRKPKSYIDPKDGKEKMEPKSWRETDARPILYGMDDCDPSQPLIIIEGEP